MVLKIEKKLVLASASPSRKMLLEQAGLTFEVKVSGVDEAVPEDFTPAQTVECLAQRKGRAVLPLCGDAAVIAADSVVSLDERIIGKPKDDEDAKATLRALSGHTHQLYTGVCLLADGKEEVFHQVTDVTFYPPHRGGDRRLCGCRGIPGQGGLLRHRGHRCGAGALHLRGLRQHRGPAGGGDPPPAGRPAPPVRPLLSHSGPPA